MYFTELFQRLRAREQEREREVSYVKHGLLRVALCFRPGESTRKTFSQTSCDMSRSWEQQFLLGVAFISIRKFGFCRVNCELMKY
jgi:hypothetical protein